MQGPWPSKVVLILLADQTDEITCVGGNLANPCWDGWHRVMAALHCIKFRP